MATSLLLFAVVATFGLVAANHESWPLAGGISVTRGMSVVPASQGTNLRSFVVVFDDFIRFDMDPQVFLPNFAHPDGRDFIYEIIWTNPRGFRLDVSAADNLPWDAFSFRYVAVESGPCKSHSECPSSQYCDIYGGCDECEVCLRIMDTHDHQACPQRCYLTDAENDQSGDGSGDGSGDMSELVFQDACLECEELELACGNGCMPVNHFLCEENPGCAINHGEGSRDAYSAPLLELSNRDIREAKAVFAAMQAGNINPHFAEEMLRETVELVMNVSSSETSCLDVVCEEPEQCMQPTHCLNGACLPFESSPTGTSCDDMNSTTDRDICDAGVCAGVDLCVVEGVVCDPPTDCQSSVTCRNGVCHSVNMPDGATCDDGDSATVQDTCTGGVCAGINECAGLPPCTALGPCYMAGECDPATGICSNPFVPLGTVCDDMDPRTVGDSCTDGSCSGQDLCANVVCAASLNQCRYSRCDFLTGSCEEPPRPTGTPCDDGDISTDFDVCDGNGVCEGQMQATVGPAKNSDAPTSIQTTLNLHVEGLAVDSGPAFSEWLQGFLVARIAGVYIADVDIVWAGAYFNTSITTLPFSQDAKVQILIDLLGNNTLQAAAMRVFPEVTNVTEVTPPTWDVAGCPSSCIPLACTRDEVEYMSEFPTVRRCCPVCVKRVDIAARRESDLETATQHWLSAMEQQDTEFQTNDQADFLDRSAQYEVDYAQWQADSTAWDADFALFREQEDRLYGDNC